MRQQIIMCLSRAGFTAINFFITDHIQSWLINLLREEIVGKKKRSASFPLNETHESKVAGEIKETGKTL